MIKLILILTVFANFAHAQATRPSHPTGNADPSQTASHEFAQKKPQKKPDSISGQCIVLAGGGNLMATPCTDLILTLVPIKGTDSISVRTEHDGTFQFTIEQGQSYKIQPGSKLYELASPTGPIWATMNLEVHLKQK